LAGGWGFRLGQACGLAILCSLLRNICNRRPGAWTNYSPKQLEESRATLMVYAFWLVLCAGAAAQLYLFPSRVSEITWGFIALASSSITLVMQHNATERERREFGIP
jgi:hypothetical protein